MEKKFFEYEGCEREIEIQITNSEMMPIIEKAFLEAQPEIEMKGFRKGKVPINIIKQLFGKKIEHASLEDAAQEFFEKAMKEDEIKVVGSPQLKKAEKIESGAVFNIVYEIMPEFELKEYKGLAIDEPVHNVKEEEIEKEIANILIKNGNPVEADEIKSDMFVVELKLNELDDATGAVLFSKEPIETTVFLHHESVYPELRTLLMDKQTGDTFNFQPPVNDQSAPNKTFLVTVKKIHELIPAELNNEFVELSSGGKFNTVQDYKDDLGFRMQESWDEQSRNSMENQIVDKLIDMYDFPIPETLLFNIMSEMVEDMKKRYKVPENDTNFTLEKLKDDLRPVAERQIRWEFIKKKIIEKEKLEVEDFDIQEFAQKESARMHTDAEIIRSAISGNENLKNIILQKKLTSFIIDFAITTETNFPENSAPDYHEHDFDELSDYDEEEYEDELDEDENSDHSHEHHHHHHGHDDDHHHHYHDSK